MKKKKLLPEINEGVVFLGLSGCCRYQVHPGDIFCRGCGTQVMPMNGHVIKKPCPHCKNRTQTRFTKHCPMCSRKLRKPPVKKNTNAP